MIENKDNNLSSRWADLIKEAIVLGEEQKVENIKNSCAITKQFFEINKDLNPSGTKAVDLICDYAIDYQEKQRDLTKKAIGYQDTKSKKN